MSVPSPLVDRRRFRRWTEQLRNDRPDEPVTSVTAAVVLAVADALGIEPPDVLPCRPLAPSERPDAAWCSPRLPGLVHEAMTDLGERRRRGAWFTPPPLVDGLVALALDDGFEPESVLDPACGGGAFLLGVADALRHRGREPAEVLGRLVGVDLDQGAVDTTRWALQLWAAAAGARAPEIRVWCGDGLAEDVGTVDLVVGNPPFASPLRSVEAAAPAARYRAARPHLGPYADAAACFLDRSSTIVAEGGRLVLVLPQSLLAARDASRLISRLQAGWDLRQLWITSTPVFDASVHVFAPVLQRRPSTSTPPAGDGGGGRQSVDAGGVRVHGGVEVRQFATAAAGASWADAASLGLGVPAPVTEGGATLASLVTATSGFRDQHYGLAAACCERADAPDGLPLVTVGQIDPLTWRRSGPIRFAGRRWDDPVIDVDDLSPAMAAWVERQRRPKVLLATQTRVLEPLIDRTGELVPTTPVIAVHAPPEALSAVAAVLLAPPIVVWAARRGLGTALHPGSIKLAARDVGDVPCPVHEPCWRAAAQLLEEVGGEQPASEELLVEVATLMCRAYGVEPASLLPWWSARLDRRRPRGARCAGGTIAS